MYQPVVIQKNGASEVIRLVPVNNNSYLQILNIGGNTVLVPTDLSKRMKLENGVLQVGADVKIANNQANSTMQIANVVGIANGMANGADTKIANDKENRMQIDTDSKIANGRENHMMQIGANVEITNNTKRQSTEVITDVTNTAIGHCGTPMLITQVPKANAVTGVTNVVNLPGTPLATQVPKAKAVTSVTNILKVIGAPLATQIPKSKAVTGATSILKLPDIPLATQIPESKAVAGVTNIVNMPGAPLATQVPKAQAVKGVTNIVNLPDVTLATQVPTAQAVTGVTSKVNLPCATLTTQASVVNTATNGTNVAAGNCASTTASTEVPRVNAATLVFFDLETTGLPCTVGKSNVQITEISMVAVGRNDFCRSSFPDMRDIRIVNKLSLCTRPRYPVSYEAANITGLNNINLQTQGPFDENTAATVVGFLSHLRKPVCVLAHNGKTFDFPILKSEVERCNLKLPSDVYLVDTLAGFNKMTVPDLPLNQKLNKNVKFKKNGELSNALQNLHLYFFGKKSSGSHSSEGDCMTLAKVCHKVRDTIIPWIEENCMTFDSIKPMW